MQDRRPVKAWAIRWGKSESERHSHEWRDQKLPYGERISVCDCGAVRDTNRRPLNA